MTQGDYFCGEESILRQSVYQKEQAAGVKLFKVFPMHFFRFMTRPAMTPISLYM
jgi:hypothetical protein